MLLKTVVRLIAVFFILFSGSAGAVTFPLPANWTMYSVGLNTYSNYLPYYESQAEAAAQYFKLYYLYVPERACKRIYWDRLNSGPYTDMAWKDRKWIPCTITTVTSLNVDNSIAPPFPCKPSSTEPRCFLYGSVSTLKNIGPCDECKGKVGAGNPIDVGTGNKFQAEQDFTVPGSPWLSFTRYYNSSPAAANRISFGRHWSHSLSYSLGILAPNEYELKRPDGSSITISANGPDADENGVLTSTPQGWTFDTGAGALETYDLRGRIVRIDFQNGGWLVYAYAASTEDNVSTVTDHFGRVVAFTYDTALRVASVTAPGGSVYSYVYGTFDYTVTKPDGAVRKYLMDENINDASSNTRGQLTGILDEAGARFATFKYDKYGRAFSTEHAGGAQKFTVSYGSDGVTNTVTTPTVASKQFTFANVVGVYRATGSGTTCTDGSCGQAAAGAFDSRGNRTYLVTEAGVKSCFAYDQARNLLIKSVEGLAAGDDCATALASPPLTSRILTTEWHPTFRKPTVQAGPLLKIVVDYDTSARVLSMSQIPTADTNGADGTAAVATGFARTVSYTYNTWGQPLTVTGPKPGEVSSTTYDTAGNVLTTTNAAGHVTAFANYTASGQPQSIAMPSGAGVVLTYDSRGRLKTHAEEGETTTLTYNGIGLMTQAALPTGETLTYAYDLAQRLTSVTDARSQKVTYTLNAAGVPTAQQVTNANASVALSVTKVYDMLGRLKQVTGAQGL